MRSTFYVQFEATRNRAGAVTAVKAARISQGRPHEPLPGAVLTKLVVDVPEHVFQPLEAEGVIHADQVEVIPVEPADPTEELDR